MTIEQINAVLKIDPDATIKDLAEYECKTVEQLKFELKERKIKERSNIFLLTKN